MLLKDELRTDLVYIETAMDLRDMLRLICPQIEAKTLTGRLFVYACTPAMLPAYDLSNEDPAFRASVTVLRST